MPRLPTVTPQDLVRVLERAGFDIDHQTGSHVVLWRSSDSSRVVVPWHSHDLGRGLTLRIIKSAGLTRDEFVELLKQ
jgi:predicted RNA binding protein YcfA (HicA-like mRNA interferase family)